MNYPLKKRLPLDTQRAHLPAASAMPMVFATLHITLDAAGAIYLEDFDTLVVSDLHLEKGSRSGRRGFLAPALDTYDTLARLTAVIDRYQPARLICLGDSFDDRDAGERMIPADREQLTALCGAVGSWIWISGNHDPAPPAFCDGERLDAIDLGGVAFRHQPCASDRRPQIVGHFHPKVGVAAGGTRFSGPCFCVGRDLMIMPAFGAYTGGLSCNTPAISSLFAERPSTIMIYRAKLLPIGGARLGSHIPA